MPNPAEETLEDLIEQIEEYVHYTHGYAQTKDANYGRDFGGFCQEEFVDHCLFHEYDEIVCHIVSADDIEIDVAR